MAHVTWADSGDPYSHQALEIKGDIASIHNEYQGLAGRLKARFPGLLTEGL
jgi:hypothetical protein